MVVEVLDGEVVGAELEVTAAVEVAAAEVAAAEDATAELLAAAALLESMHCFPSWQNMPIGQQEFPHCCIVASSCVVKSGLSGCKATFCRLRSQLMVETELQSFPCGQHMTDF